MEPSNQHNLIDDIIFWVWSVIVSAGLIILILSTSGCATRPDVMKTEKDCMKGKIHKVGSVYICLEVGGDAKSKIF